MTGALKPSWCFTACKTTALLGLCLTCIGYIYTIVYLISLPQIKIPNPIDKTHSFRSDVGVPVDNTRSKVITVALLIPVRSRHGTNDVSQLSLFQELLPSLLNSILCDIQSNIQSNIPLNISSSLEFSTFLLFLLMISSMSFSSPKTLDS